MRAHLLFFFRALHKMTDICNFLHGSVSINLEREVSIHVIRMGKQGHSSKARTFLITPLVNGAQLGFMMI